MRCPVGCVLRLYHLVSAGPDGRHRHMHRQQSNPAHQREMGGIRLPGFVAIDGRPAMSRMAFAIDAAWHRWPRQRHTCINSKQAEPVSADTNHIYSYLVSRRRAARKGSESPACANRETGSNRASICRWKSAAMPWIAG